MAFNRYLIKIGANDVFFNKYIVLGTYKTSKKVQDLDSVRDAMGVLHRNALEHSSYTIEFQTKPMSNTELQELMTAIRSNYINANERKLSLTFFVPEHNDYVTQDVYMPDIDFPINVIQGNDIQYNSITLKFIGY